MSDRSDPEIAAEQAYLDAVYDRLDAMRDVGRERRGGLRRRAPGRHPPGPARTGHRGRDHPPPPRRARHRRRAPLLRPDRPGDDGDRFYVGRLAVDDAERTPLVIDWRAPVAEPFYRATALDPMGVLRRRHLLTRNGREVVGLDDEVFDADAVEAAGLKVARRGRAARRARAQPHRPHGRHRRHHPDRAGRRGPGRPARRRSIVAGGPGTGKTAVALHRAAYLLYTFRRRLGSQGVLLVGPSPVFLRYIEQVLPSLGEHEVQLATVARPEAAARRRPAGPARGRGGQGRRPHGHGPAHARSPTASARRARTSSRASTGCASGSRAASAAALLERVQRRRGHAQRAPAARRADAARPARRAVPPALARTHRDVLSLDDLDDFDSGASYDPQVAAALPRGETPPREWERELTGRLRRHPEVRKLLERMWPVLTGAELVHDLFSFEALIRSAADGVLSPRGAGGAVPAPLGGRAATCAWTEADVALVDEADALLGPGRGGPPAPAGRAHVRGPRGGRSRARASCASSAWAGSRPPAGSLAERYGDGSGPTEDAIPELRTFGHVLVDEAQDLTPMQWRMLARRCPTGSMTIVGDFGQASRPGRGEGLGRGARPCCRRHDAPRRVTLTVNYRTPGRDHGPGQPAAHGRRGRGRADAVGAPDRAAAPASPGSTTSSAAAVDAARAARGRGRHGRGHRAGRPARRDHRRARRPRRGRRRGRRRSTRPIGVLRPDRRQGPRVRPRDRRRAGPPGAPRTPAGLRLLYVTLTRATQTLTVVHADGLPEALAP